MKLITFSLWGNDPKYCVGAIRNAELMRKIYPGWLARFYVSETVPSMIVNELKRHTSEVIEVAEPGNWTGMFWRFQPANEDDVEAFISRDCDSRISEREAAAVDEWMKGPRLIHVMRDHPHHSAPMMGGMWGAKKGALPDLKDQIDQYTRGDFWQVDQNFLREIVWPANCHKVVVHDDWNRFRFSMVENRFFPTRRKDKEFVGEILDAHDRPVYPEHNEML